VAQESGYSHQHVLTVTEEETEEVALCS